MIFHQEQNELICACFSVFLCWILYRMQCWICNLLLIISLLFYKVLFIIKLLYMSWSNKLWFQLLKNITKRNIKLFEVYILKKIKKLVYIIYLIFIILYKSQSKNTTWKYLWKYWSHFVIWLFNLSNYLTCRKIWKIS